MLFLALCITSLNLMALDITVEDAEGLIHDDIRLNNDNQTSSKSGFLFMAVKLVVFGNKILTLARLSIHRLLILQ